MEFYLGQEDCESCAQQIIYHYIGRRWLRDAFGHLKVIGYIESAAPIFTKAAVSVDADGGVVGLEGPEGLDAFITSAKQHRVWEREPSLRSPG
jgi:catalase